MNNNNLLKRKRHMILTLSTTGSKTKPKLNNLIFHTVDLQLEELKDKLEQGFTISGLYDHKGEWKNTGKGVLKNHYIGSYTVNIDLDCQEISMEEKLEQITLLPTIAYKTFSNDNSKGKYRYRFIYVFDNIILGELNYEKIFNEICGINDFDYDKNAKVGYKLFHGTDKEVLITGKTYKPSNFKCNLNCDDCGLCKPVTTTSYQFENKEFEKDFARMPYADIVEKYKGIYRNIQQSQLPFADADTPVIELPDDFFEIVRPWKKGMEKNEIVRIKNHCHRRIKLYNNLVIRKLITPNLTFDEMVYALCYEMEHFIDNSDSTDYITRQQLIGIAENAFIADTSKFNYIKPRKSVVNVKYMIKYNKSKTEVRNMCNGQNNTKNNIQTKRVNSEVISMYYNPNLSDETNISDIADMTGIKISRTTLWRWKKENGYTRGYKNKEDNQKDKVIQEHTETNLVESISNNCDSDTKVEESQGIKIMHGKEFLRAKAIAEMWDNDYNNSEMFFGEALWEFYKGFCRSEYYKKLATDFGLCFDCCSDDYDEYHISIRRDLMLTYYEKEKLRNSQLVKVLEKMGLADDFISNFENYFNDCCKMYGWFDDYLYEFHEDLHDSVIDIFYFMVECLNTSAQKRENGLEELVKLFIKKSFEGFGGY